MVTLVFVLFRQRARTRAQTSKFTIDAAKEFRIEMANAQALNIGMGRNTNAPNYEIYTQVYIYKF